MILITPHLSCLPPLKGAGGAQSASGGGCLVLVGKILHSCQRLIIFGEKIFLAFVHMFRANADHPTRTFFYCRRAAQARKGEVTRVSTRMRRCHELASDRGVSETLFPSLRSGASPKRGSKNPFGSLRSPLPLKGEAPHPSRLRRAALPPEGVGLGA